MKSLDRAKSRLDVGRWRPLFALAFAFDVTATLLASSMVRSVHVLTSDERLGSLFPEAVDIVVDTGGGLNPELERALRVVRGRQDGPVAVVNADLPALSTADFDTAARAALRSKTASFVPDADDRGTTAIFTQTRFDSMLFGPESNRRFESAGMRRIDAPVAIRRDVDTIGHLEQAAALGLAHWTRRAVKTIGRLEQ